jgi:hypothetical protein
LSWRVSGLPDYIARDAEAMLDELLRLQLQAIRQMALSEATYGELYAAAFGGVDLAGWVYRPPREIADGVIRLIREIGLFILADDGAALGHMRTHAFWLTRQPPVRQARSGYYTPTRRQQQDNREALQGLVHRTSALAFAERLPSLPLGPAAEAQALRRNVVEIFDHVIEEAGRLNDRTLRMLRQVYATSMQLINQRAASPAEEEVLQLKAPMPSLVCAHWAYREARQFQRIRDANPVAHPNFMPLRLTVPAWP